MTIWRNPHSTGRAIVPAIGVPKGRFQFVQLRLLVATFDKLVMPPHT